MKRSAKVALCGMIAALCVLLLFATGLIPFGTYALPTLAGLLMVAVVAEAGGSWALTLYVAVSLLSLILTPDKEAMLMFIMFFGHYPITKQAIEKISFKPLCLLIKFLVFNACIIFAYMIIIFVFQIPDVLTEMGLFGKWSAIILLALGNTVFITYDFALTSVTRAYLYWFRPRFLRRSAK